MKKTNRLRKVPLFVLTFIVLLVVFCFFCNEKSVWFCDEVYTLESANGIGKVWPRSNANIWQNGSDMEQYFAATGDSLALTQVATSLYDDHMPLYFWIYRIISWLFFRNQATFVPGVLINLFFFISVFVLGWFILRKVTQSDLIACGGCLLAFGLLPLFLAQATMFRMYMMLTADVAFLLACAYLIMNNVIEKKYKVGPFIYLLIVSTIGLLTHFDYWIFYAGTASIFCLFFVGLSLIRHQKKFWKSIEFYSVLSWVVSFVAAMSITVVLFPYCVWNINRDKGKMALNSLFVFSKDKIRLICQGFEKLSTALFGLYIPEVLGVFLFFAIGIVGLILLHKQGKIKEFWGLLLTDVVCVGYSLIVAFTMPAEFETRYFWCAYSVLFFATYYCIVLIFKWIQSQWNGKKKEKTYNRIYGVCLAVVLVAYAGMMLCQIDGGRGIPYLTSDKDVSALEENKEIPWVMYCGLDAYSAYDFVMASTFCVLDITNQEAAEQALLPLKEQPVFVLYCNPANMSEAISTIEDALDATLSLDYLTTSTMNEVYLVGVLPR